MENSKRVGCLQVGEDDDVEPFRDASEDVPLDEPFRDVEVLAANEDDEERYWSLTGRPVYDSFKNFCGFRPHILCFLIFQFN